MMNKKRYYIELLKKVKQPNFHYTSLYPFEYTADYSQMGYYWEKTDDGKYKLTISMGKQSTIGYDVSVQRSWVIDDVVYFNIVEMKESVDYFISTYLETPIRQYVFTKKPKDIVVESPYGEYQYVKNN